MELDVKVLWCHCALEEHEDLLVWIRGDIKVVDDVHQDQSRVQHRKLLSDTVPRPGAEREIAEGVTSWFLILVGGVEPLRPELEGIFPISRIVVGPDERKKHNESGWNLDPLKLTVLNSLSINEGDWGPDPHGLHQSVLEELELFEIIKGRDDLLLSFDHPTKVRKDRVKLGPEFLNHLRMFGEEVKTPREGVAGGVMTGKQKGDRLIDDQILGHLLTGLRIDDLQEGSDEISVSSFSRVRIISLFEEELFLVLDG